MYLLGDYNLPALCFVDCIESCSDVLKNKKCGEVLVESMAYCNLDQINRIPNANNVFLDLIFSNCSVNVESVYNILVTCDHPSSSIVP